jgi:DNA-binding NarL/FixJ family response regulator
VTPLRLLLVDDHVLFRRGVEATLAHRPGLQMVGEAGDGLEALERARELQPDVILMDISMPRCSGVQAVEAIKREFPAIKIVMLTVSDADEDLFGAVRAGAEGYLLKDVSADELCALLEGVHRGEAPVSRVLAARILQELRGEAAVPTPQALTQREVDVLRLVVEGLANADIAARLCVTENTIKMHLRHILDKLHLANRVQAAVYAVRQGLDAGRPEAAPDRDGETSPADGPHPHYPNG